MNLLDMKNISRSCAYCKHQIRYVFHATCNKNYSECYSNGKYIFFERVK